MPTRICLLPALLSAALLGQQQLKPSDRSRMMLLDHFLQQIAVLQQEPGSSTTTTSLNIPVPTIREHFRTAYDLDDQTLAVLAERAASYSARVRALDARAAAIINQAKQQYRVRAGVKGAMVPPPPPELAKLQADRDTAGQNVLDDLEQTLGPAQLRYLLYQIQIRLGTRLTAVPLAK